MYNILFYNEEYMLALYWIFNSCYMFLLLTIIDYVSHTLYKNLSLANLCDMFAINNNNRVCFSYVI